MNDDAACTPGVSVLSSTRGKGARPGYEPARPGARGNASIHMRSESVRRNWSFPTGFMTKVMRASLPS